MFVSHGYGGRKPKIRRWQMEHPPPPGASIFLLCHRVGGEKSSVLLSCEGLANSIMGPRLRDMDTRGPAEGPAS